MLKLLKPIVASVICVSLSSTSLSYAEEIDKIGSESKYAIANIQAQLEAANEQQQQIEQLAEQLDSLLNNFNFIILVNSLVAILHMIVLIYWYKKLKNTSKTAIPLNNVNSSFNIIENSDKLQASDDMDIHEITYMPKINKAYIEEPLLDLSAAFRDPEGEQFSPESLVDSTETLQAEAAATEFTNGQKDATAVNTAQAILDDNTTGADFQTLLKNAQKDIRTHAVSKKAVKKSIKKKSDLI